MSMCLGGGGGVLLVFFLYCIVRYFYLFFVIKIKIEFTLLSAQLFDVTAFCCLNVTKHNEKGNCIFHLL